MADYFKEIQSECFSSVITKMIVTSHNSKHCNLNKNRSLNNNQFSLYSEFIYLQICLLIEVQTPIYGHSQRCRAGPNSCQRAAQPHLQQNKPGYSSVLQLSHRKPLFFPESFSTAILSFKKAVMDLKKKASYSFVQLLLLLLTMSSIKFTYKLSSTDTKITNVLENCNHVKIIDRNLLLNSS